MFRETQNVRKRVNVGVLEYVMRVLERWIYIHVFSMAFSTLERLGGAKTPNTFRKSAK